MALDAVRHENVARDKYGRMSREFIILGFGVSSGYGGKERRFSESELGFLSCLAFLSEKEEERRDKYGRISREFIILGFGVSSGYGGKERRFSESELGFLSCLAFLSEKEEERVWKSKGFLVCGRGLICIFRNTTVATVEQLRRGSIRLQGEDRLVAVQHDQVAIIRDGERTRPVKDRGLAIGNPEYSGGGEVVVPNTDVAVGGVAGTKETELKDAAGGDESGAVG
ncbi:hypothetical protein M5K25_023460 [Dendrobium thyrsiflorum]|uniref:Uncharacterized protein n=1 Tax=Dendrobium thyrsiflorum TaxID=117978 RepID=A0ABD0U8U2_DENTH